MWDAPAVFIAAFIAGAMNAIAGGGTLVSFPALLWLGRPPILANATNTVALLPGSIAGAFGFRHELMKIRRWLLILFWPSLAGGFLGSYVLLHTPEQAFRAIIPYLLLFATILLMIGPRLQRWLPRSSVSISVRRWAALAFFQFLVGFYGGYFGAGIGILMLAALELMGLEDIHQMNGLKNVLAFTINGIAALYFIQSRAVLWGDVVWMALGAMAGGYASSAIARRVDRIWVRRTVVAIGFLVAFRSFFH
ncbi:MAG TPA: sulfite exporter TauE/SafE family protein [Thermoflexus sp.]|nr:sulfite exporter TauE/SafE family protein [Thermoflexus sp.]